MQIKRFEAKDMTVALARIKREFGPEAVILSAKSVKKPGGLLGLPKDGGVVVTAAIDPSQVPAVKKMSQGRENDSGGPGDFDLLNQNRKNRLLDSLQSGLGTLRKKGSGMKMRKNAGPDKQGTDGMHGFLLNQGVEAAIAADLAGRLPPTAIGFDGRDRESAAIAMTGALEQMGALAGPVKIEKSGQTVVAFVGPTGVGKTTVIAKLAAAQAIDMGRRVGLISLDCQRIGAVEQMRIFADIIGVPMEVAADRKTLDAALGRLGNCELVLVDTQGAGVGNRDVVTELSSLFAARRGLSIQLVLSAATKSEDLDAAVGFFDPLPVDGLLFTKLDESTTYGNVVNQLVKTGLPVSYLSDGQQVPEDLYPATIRRLVDLLTRAAGRQETISRSDVAPGQAAVRTRRPTRGRAPAQAATAPAASVAGAQAPFVANINSDIFHRPDCKWTKMIKPGNMIEFGSIEDAAKKGFTPCRYCRPNRANQSGQTGQGRSACRPGAARKIAGYR